MSTTDDFDRIAGAWLAEGPAELSDRVLDAALGEVHLTHQRRRLAPWRTSPMSSTMRLAAAVVAVLAIGLLAINLPRIAGIAATPAPSATPTAAPSPSPSLGPTPSAAAEPTPTAPPALGSAFPSGSMPAGTYHSAPFQPTIVLTLPAGWTHRYEDTEGLVLVKGKLELYVIHSEPLAAAETRAHDRGYTTSPTTLGRYSGFTTDVSAPLAASTTIFIDAGLRAWDSTAGSVTKSWVVDMDGPVVSFAFFAPPDEFPAALAGVEAIVSSLGEAP